MARLLIDVMQENRAKERFLLHEFVVMVDHFHLILTPASEVSLEKAIGCIKGGFSFRSKRELAHRFLIWEEGFTNHRIRNEQDYETHRAYIHQNPVKEGLSAAAADYPYSSAFPGALIDPKPPWLEPSFAALKGRSPPRCANRARRLPSPFVTPLPAVRSCGTGTLV